MDSTPIYQYAKPTSASLGPPQSIEPILTPGYELCPNLIKLIWDQSFSREGDENPYYTYKSLNGSMHAYVSLACLMRL
jgi:hypothetical protein